jgi:elongation factor 1 alpha-like protein
LGGSVADNNIGCNFQLAARERSTISCGIPKDFWDDMRWLNVHVERQTIFVEPSYPRGGLLGGASDATPKMSKLQTLAAARKKKAQEQKSSACTSAEDVDKPMADLSINQPAEGSKSTAAQASSTSISKETPRRYPVLKRKNSDPHEKTLQPAQPAQLDEPSTVEAPKHQIPLPSIEEAKPSAFANTMFCNDGTHPSRRFQTSHFTLPYLANASTSPADAFAGPSPDDVVLAAQSKGSAHSANPRK